MLFGDLGDQLFLSLNVQMNSRVGQTVTKSKCDASANFAATSLDYALGQTVTNFR